MSGGTQGAELLHAHPAWPAALTPGQGWSAPALAAPREIPIEAANAATLETLGIRLRTAPGPGCRVLLDAATPVQRLTLDLARARDFTLLLGPAARLAGEVAATGAGSLLAAAGEGGAVPFHLRSTFRGDRCLVLIGHGATSNLTSFLAEGPESAILVGDDAMFAVGTALRTSDSHAVIDIASRRQVNAPRPVLIGPHVWLGQDALVMKGVRIGAGAIVAGRAVVTREVPARTMVAGVPARVIREGVTWTRQSRPTAAQIEAMLRDLPGG
ncbi:acyltransferase [Falsiroseomonas sp.]|uniref:acyltransferase n=1 Tax=Falsiroseomonas sp. TaxID=2870721 RepID=UPI0035623C46